MRSWIIAILIFCSSWIQAQDEGIIFFEGDWNTLLRSAQKLDQPIFIDCYTDWCAPCKKMDRIVFPDPQLGAFFNKHFLSIKLDMEKGKGKEIRKQYKVNAFPQFLFINFKGELLHKSTGYKTVERMMAEGKKALPVPKSLSQMHSQYVDRILPDSLLFDYLHSLQLAGEPFGEAFNQYIDKERERGGDVLSDRNLTLVFKQLGDLRNAEFSFMQANREIFDTFFDSLVVDQKVRLLLDENAFQAGKTQDRENFDQLLKLIKKEYPKEQARLIQREEMIFARAGKDWEAFFTNADMYVANYLMKEHNATNQGELERIVSVIGRHDSNPDRLANAQNWISNSIKITKNAHKLLIDAELLLKLGKIKKAEKETLEAISILEEKGRNTSAAESLLQKIRDQKD